MVKGDTQQIRHMFSNSPNCTNSLIVGSLLPKPPVLVYHPSLITI